MKETWKDIKNYEGLYQVSNLGRIKSLIRHYHPKEQILNPTLVQGYFYIILSKNNIHKSFKVSRLTAQTFITNPENKPQVNHKDGIKTHDYIENLEWCTNQENTIHSFKMGLQIPVKGEKHGKSKLKENDILKIRRLRNDDKLTLKTIANLFNITITTVYDILHGKSWGWL
jgi:hypothetical protein